MSDVYRTSGNFHDSDDTLRISFNIKEPTLADEYEFYKKYDISQVFQNTSGQEYTINGVVVYLRKKVDPGLILSPAASATTWPSLPSSVQSIDKFQPYTGSVNKFDFKAADALVILYHDDTFKQEHIDEFYKDLKEYYDGMKATATDFQSFTMPEIISSPKKTGNQVNIDDDGPVIKPRVAGLTIITRKP